MLNFVFQLVREFHIYRNSIELLMPPDLQIIPETKSFPQIKLKQTLITIP